MAFSHYAIRHAASRGAVRSGSYKLLEYFENNTVQLFNLDKDLGENYDLSESEPKVKELTSMLHAWWKSVDAQMLSPNPDYIEIDPLNGLEEPMPTTNGFVAVVRTIHEIRNDYKISFPDMKLYQTFYHIAALALFGSNPAP